VYVQIENTRRKGYIETFQTLDAANLFMAAVDTDPDVLFCMMIIVPQK